MKISPIASRFCKIGTRQKKSSPTNQTNQKQQNQSPNDARDDVVDQTRTNRNADLPEKPSPHETAKDADDDVANRPETITVSDNPSEPAAACSDDECENELIQIHFSIRFGEMTKLPGEK